MNWYYYDNAGRRFGPVNETQLRVLASRKLINQSTILEDEQGATAAAWQRAEIFSSSLSAGYQENVLQAPKNRATAGLLAVSLGIFGVQKYYVGSWGWGLVFSLGGLFTLGIVWLAGIIVGIADGMTWLNMTDSEFEAKYSIVEKNPFRW